jgi:hypothetical protein
MLLVKAKAHSSQEDVMMMLNHLVQVQASLACLQSDIIYITLK